jgi:alkaline phosphatase D
MALELTPGAASCEWRFMDTVREKSTRLSGTHRMVTASGANRFTA